MSPDDQEDFDFSKIFDALGPAKGSPVEPNGDLRGAAAGLFELYQSFVQSGFTEDQAFALTGLAFQSIMQGIVGGAQ